VQYTVQNYGRIHQAERGTGAELLIVAHEERNKWGLELDICITVLVLGSREFLTCIMTGTGVLKS
jgi:hypothetical protein